MSALLGAGGGGGGGAPITANTTYYVRTTGNDSNTGISPANAWLTLAHAFNVLNFLNVQIPGTGTITLDIGAGTFTGGFFSFAMGQYNGSSVTIQGAGNINGGTPTIINDGFQFFSKMFSNILITNLHMFALSGGGALITIPPPGAFIQADSCSFDMGSVYIGTGCMELTGGSGEVSNSFITGNGDFVIFAQGSGGGTLDTNTYTGTTSFVDAVMRISFGSNCQDNLGHTVTGTVTGFKYTAEGDLWFPFGGGAIQSGPGSKNGIITSAGNVFTGTDFHHKVTHTQSTGGVYNYQSPSTGFSITLTDTDYHVIIDPSAGLASGTITMPPAPIDGETIDFRFSQPITAITFSPSAGQSIVAAPSAITASQIVTAIWDDPKTTWYFGTGGTSGGGGGSPSPPNLSIQYDNGGSFGGAANASIASGDVNEPTGKPYRVNGSAFAWEDANQNVVVGISAGNFGVISGQNNCCLGNQAGNALTSGNSNFCMGVGAGAALTSGTANLCLGVNAMNSETTGGDNVAVGPSAMHNQNGVNFTTAIGTLALFANDVGTGNIGVGFEAGQNINGASSNNNLFVGYQAGNTLTTGSASNVFVGYQAGQAYTTANNSVILGNFPGSATTLTSNIIIADGAGNNRMQYNGGWLMGAAGGGGQGVGTLNVSSGLFLNGTAYTNPKWVIQYHYTGETDDIGAYAPPAPYHGRKSLSDLEQFMRERHELPLMTMLGGKQDLFRGSDLMLASLEEAYLYILDLHKRIEALEKRCGDI